jgi:hypothetical protein
MKLISQRQRAWRTFSRNRSALVGLIMINRTEHHQPAETAFFRLSSRPR